MQLNLFPKLPFIGVVHFSCLNCALDLFDLSFFLCKTECFAECLLLFPHNETVNGEGYCQAKKKKQNILIFHIS